MTIIINLDITLRNLGNLQRNIPLVLDQALDKISNEAVDLAKKNSHVVKGNLQKSNSKKKVAQMHYLVGNSAEYAAIENSRGGSKGVQGTHDFFDRMVSQVEKTALSRVDKEIQNLLRRG